MSTLFIYNSLAAKKEEFIPLLDKHVGLYVCGPTVYNKVHIGNVRTFLAFDVMVRYFFHLGYKVRYVRNITDVGHLTEDSDEEDKIAKMARLMRLEPMEIVKKYSDNFHDVLRQMNFLPPTVEPTATGHLIEQLDAVETLLEKGFAYEVGGSVYFDVEKYNSVYKYGILSNRNIEDLLGNTRNLKGQDEKKSPLDFALWKNADSSHIMQWTSPWGKGFPGWHLECSVMSTKYLGEKFDIHGGGMDLKFPHHECEIAQNCALSDEEKSVNYWVHTNMVTLDGEKMSKSKGNSILPEEFFTGNHDLLDKAYSPMVMRFFMMQTHYRSTLDISIDALSAAEKGYTRLMKALLAVDVLTQLQEQISDSADSDLAQRIENSLDAFINHMNDDLNTARALAALFDLSSIIFSFANSQLDINTISSELLARLKSEFSIFITDILGLKNEIAETSSDRSDDLIRFLIQIRQTARSNKDFATSDAIRDRLAEMGIQLLDGPSGTDYTLKN